MAIIDRIFAPGSGFQKNFFFLARRFVAGETVDSAIAAVRELNAAGMTATLDFLGETDLSASAAADTIGAVIKDRDDLDLVTGQLEELIG